MIMPARSASGRQLMPPTLVILFNEQATPAIKAVALIQRFTTANQSERLTMTTQSIVVIDGQHYQVTYVGALVNENLNNIGHVALIFDSAPEEDQPQSGLCHKMLVYKANPILKWGR